MLGEANNAVDVAMTQGPGVAVLILVWWDLRRTVAKLVTRVTRLEVITDVSAGSGNVRPDATPGDAA